MAISKNGLTILALLVTLIILETGNDIEFSSPALPANDKEEYFLPHTREKRDVTTGQWDYIIDVVMNVSNVETFELIQNSLNATSLPIQLDNNTKITDVSVTTVCSSNGTGFQCRCEEQFAWPYSTCVSYGACDYISSGICKCINAIPADGQSCQPISKLLVKVEYTVDLELNVTDVTTVDYLRSLLNNDSFALTLGPTVNVTDIDITTVCYLNGTDFQCRCEDQYVWSYVNCITYGACDDIIDGTCGCINSIPSSGQHCEPRKVVYEYEVFIEVNTTDADQLRNTVNNITFPVQINTQINISDTVITTVCSQNGNEVQCRCEDDHRWPCDKCATYGTCEGGTNNTCGCIKAFPTDGQYCLSIHHQNYTVCESPPAVYEYIISVELNISDVAVINGLRTILNNISYPISINNHIQISDVNISTVCSPSSGGFQCRCEDQYRWSCDQCFQHGPCDNITDDTCGCINAIPPDGQYCQSVYQHNFTACPVTTTSPPTTPPAVYEYIISVELNISDVAVINGLRTILNNISYPISINNHIQISDVNISTVCSPSSGGFQCRCEDQYRWSCDQCFQHGPCDNITDDTCGCINAIPPDGQYCQSVYQHNFTACPVTTTSPPTTPPAVYEYIISVELNISDVAVINGLRTILNNISYPISINNHIQISDVNISTVCSPSSGGFQCRCEDQYRWSCDQCFQHGPCDNITDDTCGCINAIPPDGQYCQSVNQHNFTACPVTTTSPPTTPPAVYEYIISVELNISDVAVINGLRTILNNISYPISINNHIQISDVNISTVCSPSSGGFQCRCEDQYRWSCDQCFQHGPCDNITDDTCGCINAIPPDGQYCQSVYQHNFTACPVTTTSPPTTPPAVYEYIISVELNISDVAVINGLRTILNNISYPISINNHIQISDVNISTVCSPSSGGFQCRCEDQYRWSCDQCFQHGPCDNITDDTCGCINAIPPDGQYCQSVYQHNFTACPVTTTSPPTTPPAVYEYIISVELNISDVAVINGLRTILNNISYPISINNHIQISDVNISTVCSPSSGGFQCRCEDQYRWSCDQCFQHGPCDNITDDTCGCINAIPPDGQYCQSVYQHNFTACPVTTTSPPTTPPAVYEYIISVELNISDVAVINGLRTILNNISYPISINNHIQISDVNISTVCSPSSGGFQCRCEDQYRWSCDQCFQHGPCDNITDDTCGCINAIPPDGQYCQSVYQHNFTACPVTTTSPPTTPPAVYEYIISVELNISDVAVINGLRTILNNISYPISINNHIQISDVNISTVCSPSSGGFQCRCEDQYRWSCDQCFQHGPCDNITDDTCGCINAVPPDGQYCQSVNQHNFTACPVRTTSPPTNTTTVATTQNTTFFTTPTVTTDATTGVNTTALTTTPTMIITNATTDATTGVNITTVTTTPTMNVTNSTSVGTTPVNSTTPTMSPTNATTGVNTTTLTTTPTTTVTNSTTDATTGVNTTALTITPTTTVRNSTPVATPNSNTTATTTPTTVTTTRVTSHNTTSSSTISEITSTPAQTTALTTTTKSTTTTPTMTTTTALTTTTTTTPSLTTTTTTTPTMTTTTALTTTTTTTPSLTTTTTPTMTTTTVTTTISTTTISTSPTPEVPEFDVEMSIRLEKEFTAELSDATSSAYKDLESRIISVLKKQYIRITGFKRVFVKAFRQGSVITDFVVKTTQIIPDEFAEANEKLPEAMKPIAVINGPVTSVYNNPTPFSFPGVTYTGNSMMLTCGHDNIDVGIFRSEWKFNGRVIQNRNRFEITDSSTKSSLTVNNIILADIGLYECTLRGRAMYLSQNGRVTGNIIKQAPNVQLQNNVNVKCVEEKIQQLQCCVQSPYKVKWFQNTAVLLTEPPEDGETYCIKHNYKLESCIGLPQKKIFKCKVDEPKGYEKTTEMTIFTTDIICDDAQYGPGRLQDISTIACGNGQEGSKTAVCQETREWKLIENTCIVIEIKELLIESQDLVVEEVPEFAANLSKAAQKDKTEIANSSATVSAVVDILDTIATVSTVTDQSVMENVLQTVDVIITEESRESWAVLNANQTRNASSVLLGSLEKLSDGLVGEFTIATSRILLNRTIFNNSFSADLNSSIFIQIPDTNVTNVFITTITFSSLNNVMPVRNTSFNASLFNTNINETVTDNAINAAVVLVQIGNTTIDNVTLSYKKLNKSLSQNPQCVFWNFKLFDNLGAWDNEGCKFVLDVNDTVTCSCNHLTSFSLLMATDIPQELRDLLDYITYVGVGISLASLVICLIIEGYVWKAVTRNSTAFMRHVSIINTALSLLIADICFIIGASIAKNPLENPGEDYQVPIGPCSTATFFMHFFYLGLFFWMLVSGLLLFYRTVMVFSHMSKSTMLAIGFSLGYGCPLIIAVITVAVTAPGNGYIRRYDACWLNWIETKALLAMVIPALTVVFINILIVIVVLFKMLRRGVGETAPADEKHTLVVIARCVVILTPLFGLTWSLGVGTMVSSTNKGIHIAFAFFNSLQGFFILVFGTLFDSKIRSVLSRNLPTSSTGSNPTTSTSLGVSSLSGLNWISRLRGRRYIYRVSEAANSNSNTGVSESFVNI
ncbi:uncharacterized protein adgrf8 [Larimichthys crocea]|uniref:uncharacterized protein adgrf8 n=1 Tax=Larimichthys crocea TaxID=215358 RepID=UPI000F5EEDFD|nr:uncharacterized protein LOC104939551 [Larimichthys crocea]